MHSKIFIDHVYNEDPCHLFFKRLGKMGFTLSEMKVEHPGKAHCRFIGFQSYKNQRGFYLEFVRIGKGGIHHKSPGLSFGFRQNLHQLYKKLASKIKVEFHHKNYNWKKNTVDILPGWNFIALKNSPIRAINTWFTEYEVDKSRKKLKVPPHPNKVIGLYGLEMTLSEKGRAYLETILGKKLKVKTKLHDGTFLFIKEGRSNRFENVILKSKDLDTTRKFVKGNIDNKFDGLEALYINNPSNFKNVCGQ